MPLAVRLAVNPLNPKMRYIYWNNGRVEPDTKSPGAQPPPAVPQDTAADLPYNSGKAPIIGDSYDSEWVMRAIQITDWSTPSGYVMSKYGQVWNFGNAATVPVGSMPVTSTYPYAGYWDFVMNPAGDAQGYALGDNGTIPNIGGSPAIDNQFLGEHVAHRIYMPDWATKKYVIFDSRGRRHSRHGAVSITAKIQQKTGLQTFGPNVPLHNGYIGEACAFYNDFEAGGGDGWALASYGWVHSLNDGQLVFGPASIINHEGLAHSSDLAILDNGLGAEPLRLAILNIYGFVEEFNVSTKPTVTMGTLPADPTTTTTKPKFEVIYADPEGDAAKDWQVRAFTDDQYLAGGFDPEKSVATWSRNISGPEARDYTGEPVGVDLANDTYRVYARARDTSDLWSADTAAQWSFRQWIQNVTPPATPTMTITAGGTPLAGTLIELTATSVAAGGVYVVEYQDGPGLPWLYVRGADGLVPDVNRNASVVDREPIYTVARTYRTRQVVVDPHLVGAYSATQNVTVASSVWTVIDPFSADALTVSVFDFDMDMLVVAGVFHPDGREDPVIIWGENSVKLPNLDLKVRTLDKASYQLLEKMLKAGRVLLLRDPFGRALYFRPTGNLKAKHVRAAPTASETTPVRHFHEWTIPITATARPHVGPVSGPLALVMP